MGSKIYVGNLAYDTSEDELRNAFAGDGRTVQEVAIVMDRETGRSRGFGFVTMSSDAEAQAAIQELDGHMLGGRALKVREAEDKKRAGGGGGGGGFRGGGGGGGGGGFRGGRDEGGRGGRGGGRW
jgi:RNA recognition motif-containing protein